MSDQPLPYGRQWLDAGDIEAVVAVLRSDFLTTGPAVAAFESALCQITGAAYASAVNSGTAALHCAYFGAGLGPGDEIITSPLTFAATANAALYLGASVRFVDIDPDTGNIDPAAIEAAITPKTRLIVPVDFAGCPADYDRIAKLRSDHQLKVVADAAHSLGATYRQRRVGTLADATATSFHPVKPITTAEGGAVLSSDGAIAARAARFRTHGITREALAQPDGAWSYEMRELGYNYRLPDVLCALGASQLKKLDAFVARRRDIAATYLCDLADLDALILPHVPADIESGWHLFVARVRDASRRKPFFDALRAAGLGVQVHYIPVHFHPYYQSLGYRRGSLPKAEDFYARCVSLPIFPAMSDDDVNRVIDVVRRTTKAVL